MKDNHSSKAIMYATKYAASITYIPVKVRHIFSGYKYSNLDINRNKTLNKLRELLVDLLMGIIIKFIPYTKRGFRLLEALKRYYIEERDYTHE